MIGFDGAAPFNLDTAKSVGALVCTVYTVGHPGGYPPADAGRVAAIRARGMGVWPNWERAADFFLTCSLAEAQAAGAEQLNALRADGVPDDGTVSTPFSTDVAVDPTRYAELAQKYTAVKQGLNGRYLTACYGQGGLIDYLAAAGVTQAKGWLSGSSSFPGFNIGSPNVCMVQSHDLAGNWLENSNPIPQTDINTITDPHGMRAWWPSNSPYGGQDMPLTPADIAAVRAAIQPDLLRLADWLDGNQNLVFNTNVSLKGRTPGVMTNSIGAYALSELPKPVPAATAADIAAAVVGALPSGSVDAAVLKAAVTEALAGFTVSGTITVAGA